MFKILVVEDDKNSARLMQVILTNAGYEVELSSNGVDALKKLDEVYIDLVLLDVMMPEMNGYELTEIIRSNGLN
ncbi:MAG: response regulator, partial [Ruminococcus sp.]|nr:response regulator [Ruminococcus sp.]